MQPEKARFYHIPLHSIRIPVIQNELSLKLFIGIELSIIIGLIRINPIIIGSSTLHFIHFHAH